MSHISQESVSLRVDGREIVCRKGSPLLNELLNAGLVVQTACGGQGSCHLCRVHIANPQELPKASTLEKRALGNVLIAQGMRLSCQIDVAANLEISLPRVETPQERRARIQRARQRKHTKQ
ncbi:MAG: 2Fe-2S iron-sulfur cluster-binding protein [Myxococcota bacterium]